MGDLPLIKGEKVEMLEHGLRTAGRMTSAVARSEVAGNMLMKNTLPM